MPDPPPSHLVRERLAGLLAASSAPLALLSAPAGSGKTALAAEWAHRLAGTRDVVWVRCHAGDVDPWADVLGAMAGTSSAASRGPVRSRVAQVIEAAERAPLPWTVFLDGCEVRSAEAAEELDLLLTYAGDELQVVLTTRADPVLPLHRYRLDGALLEVRAADLAFTDDEADALLRSAGVDLEADDLHALNHRLAGWAAGLRFALPVLTAHPAPREVVSGAVTYNGNINAYLVEEVLDAQPAALRELILTTSVPDVLTPDLLEELTGEPAAPVTLSLVRANVFLEGTPGDESCLRYVPFFRDLVRAQLAFEAPARFRQLHRDVAAWHVAHGRWERAVAHLDAAGERPDGGAFLVDHLLVGRLLCERRDDPLHRLVVTTPTDGAGAGDHLLRAATALADGDHEGCSSHLDAARGAGGDAGRAAVTAAVLEAALAGLAGDAADAEPLAARADEGLAAQGRPVEPGAEDAGAVLVLARAVAALRLGAVERADRLLEAGLARPTAAWSTTYRCRCLSHAALLHARTGQGARALAEAEEALSVARVSDGSTVLATTAHLARAYAALAVGDVITARAHLAETCAHPEPLWRVVHAVVAAALERADGETEASGARLAAAAGVAETAGPWAVRWVRDETSGSSTVPERPDDVAVASGPVPGHPQSWATGPAGRVVEPLTPREMDVLAAMSEWLTTEEIAEKLFVSVNTVRTHVRNILTKLGVSRRNAAIREAYRIGLLTPDARSAATPSPVGSG